MKNNVYLRKWFILIVVLLGFPKCVFGEEQRPCDNTLIKEKESVMSLAGEWGIALDSADVGVSEQWYERSFGDKIRLPGTTDEKRKEMAANQVRELLTDYGKIDIMWFDGGHGEISNDEVRRLQPGIVINRRNKEPGDFGDSEGVLPDKRFEGWFETNDPCWPSRWWGYSQSDRMDTGGDVIEKLVILRAWGGNFLANVGPKADGSMPEEALEAWKEIGKWMKHSGESVFDVTGGTFPEQCNQPMTLKGDSVMYLHTFPNFHKEILVKGQKRKPLRAILLRTGDEIPFLYENQVLKIQIPARQRSRSVDTVKLIF